MEDKERRLGFGEEGKHLRGGLMSHGSINVKVENRGINL